MAESPDKVRPVIVVSGLPRSGTSLMMQMLAAGGVTVMVDDHRPADAGNPRGYFEYEPVKRTRKDSAWVEDARGKAVKVVHALLDALPPGPGYKVLLMRRDIGEVVASQRDLLSRLNRPGSSLPENHLAAALEAQMTRARTWLGQQSNVTVLEVEHRTLIERPSAITRSVNQFLGGALDERAMAAMVDRSLYRHRQDEKTM
jgi:hypothetical protein